MKWLALLNPMNWIKVLQYLKQFWELMASAYQLVSDWLRKRKQNKKIKEMEDAEQALEDANSIQDEEARLRAKAEAACRLEKAVNPDADC